MTIKTTSIHVRMTQTEYDALKELIGLERTSISKLIRQLIRNEARRQGQWPPIDSDTQGSETQ